MASPRRPLLHNSSSLASVSTSACLSALSEARKSQKTQSWKRLTWGLPFHLRCLIKPAVMWCKLAGGNTLMSCLLTSRMNRVSQCWSLLFGICTIEPICAAVVLLQCSLHAFHNWKQSCVSSRVSLGTPSVLSLFTSLSVFDSANLRREKLVRGLEEEIVGRSWRSGCGLDEREELETVLLGAFEAEPKLYSKQLLCYWCLKLWLLACINALLRAMLSSSSSSSSLLYHCHRESQKVSHMTIVLGHASFIYRLSASR